MEEKLVAPTFWQFLRARRGRVLFWSAVYFAALCALNTFAPIWVVWVWHSIVFCCLSYQSGGLRERKRAWEELLEARKLHQADLDRFVAFLAEQRGYVDRMQRMVGHELPKEQVN